MNSRGAYWHRKPNETYLALLLVAENAAKVIYNASGLLAPFDADCGEWLVACLHALVARVGDHDLTCRARTLLERWVCNAGCWFDFPFEPLSIVPTWLAWNDATVPRLAQTIDSEGAHRSLPVLADALEEAGCIDARVLEHLRGPGEHPDGCWVIDHILGRL